MGFAERHWKAFLVASALVGFVVYVELDKLKSGIATLDRFAIRGVAAFWSWVEGVDPRYILAIIHNESDGDPNSYAGDAGMSLGPGNIQFQTWKDAGIGTDESVWRTRMEPGHEYQGIHDVVRVYKYKLARVGDPVEAIRAYNGSGPLADAYLAKAQQFIAGLPG